MWTQNLNPGCLSPGLVVSSLPVKLCAAHTYLQLSAFWAQGRIALPHPPNVKCCHCHLAEEMGEKSWWLLALLSSTATKSSDIPGGHGSASLCPWVKTTWNRTPGTTQDGHGTGVRRNLSSVTTLQALFITTVSPDIINTWIMTKEQIFFYKGHKVME